MLAAFLTIRTILKPFFGSKLSSSCECRVNTDCENDAVDFESFVSSTIAKDQSLSSLYDGQVLKGAFSCVMNAADIQMEANAIKSRVKGLSTTERRHYLELAVRCIDLTTLSGDDCVSNVTSLCRTACFPLGEHNDLHTAAVCVYPNGVAHCTRALNSPQLGTVGKEIDIASVATGFPASQTHLKPRLEEIRLAIEDGATEIDCVVNRQLVFERRFSELFNEVAAMKNACGDKAHLKTILGAGDYSDLTQIYQVSIVCILAGTDFIKTSTGKEAINATLPIGIVMCRAALDAWLLSNGRRVVGFKPAGGLRTADDAVAWLLMVEQVLGSAWLSPQRFRIGASSLLNGIVKELRS